MDTSFLGHSEMHSPHSVTGDTTGTIPLAAQRVRRQMSPGHCTVQQMRATASSSCWNTEPLPGQTM